MVQKGSVRVPRNYIEYPSVSGHERAEARKRIANQIGILASRGAFMHPSMANGSTTQNQSHQSETEKPEIPPNIILGDE